MTLHKNIPLGGMHKSYNFEYVDAAARAGATGLTAENVGDMARQTDDNTIWMLTNHSPVTWVQQGAGTGTPILADGTVPFTGSQSMGSQKLTSVANGTVAGDAVNFSQLSAATGDISTLDGRVTVNEGDIDDLEDYAGVDIRSGFPNLLTDSTIAFNETSRLFEITPTGSTFEVWSNNVKYEKAADDITLANSQGFHWVYYDASGTLVETVNPSASVAENIIKTLGLVTIVYYDSSNSHRIWRGDERHGTAMSGATHYFLNEAIGSFLESGGGPTSIVADGDGSSATHAQFGIGASVFQKEDLDYSLGSHGSTSNWQVLYKLGVSGNWVRKNPKDAFPCATAGTGRLAWNQFTGGAWQLTEVTDENFVLAHVIATNDPDDPYMIIIGQAEYETLPLARIGAANELKTLNAEVLPALASVWLATFIFETKDSYTNAVNARIRTVDADGNEFIDWRSEKLTGTANSVTDHGSLGGLEDSDHPLTAMILPEGTPDVTTVSDGRDWWNLFNSSGAVDGFGLTDNADGSVDIAAGEVLLRSGDTDTSPLSVCKIDATAGVTLTDNAVNYIVARWNAGSPDIAVTAIKPTAQAVVPIYLAVRYGTTIDYIDFRQGTINSVAKNLYKDVGVYGFEHFRGGTVVTETGTRNLYVTAGSFYLGTFPISHNAFDTSGADTFVFIYEAVSNWTRVAAQSQLNNTQYDDGSGTLATLDDNKFGVHWVYMMLGPTPALAVLCGQAEYDTLAEAQAVLEPTDLNRPPELKNISTSELIAKVIFEKNDTNLQDVQQPWENYLSSADGLPPSGNGFEAATITNIVSTGTAGGGSTGASWNKRPLNTLDNPESYPWITFDDANDRFTLLSGLYRVSIKAQCFAAGDHQLRLRADPAGTPSTEMVGHSQQCPYFNEEASQTAEIEGVIELSTSETFQVEHYIEQTVATYGLGKASNSGEDELYCSIQIARLGS